MFTQEAVKNALSALDTAYSDILEFVPPGTPGKIDAITKIRDIATRLVFEYAHHTRNHRPFPSTDLPLDRTADA